MTSKFYSSSVAYLTSFFTVDFRVRYGVQLFSRGFKVSNLDKALLNVKVTM